MNTTIKKLLLILSIMLLTVPAFAYDFEVNGLYFNMTSVPESTCELVKGDTPYKGDIVIPETVEYRNRQFKIVSIGVAFSGNKEITSVVLPNTIGFLRDNAFMNCSSLKEITIPNSVTEIPGNSTFYYGCFEGCTSLQTCIIPNCVTIIGPRAFNGCASLQTISIPNSVEEIGSEAFCDCTSLQTISIPNSVVRINFCTFRRCTSLQTILIPNSVEEIHSCAFEYCTSLKAITIPNSLKEIGEFAFRDCTSLQNIVTPTLLETIEKGTYQNCTSLKTITIPGTIHTIKSDAFSGCKNLKEIVFDHGKISCTISSGYGYNGRYSSFQATDIKTLILGRELDFSGYNKKDGFKCEFGNVETLRILKGRDTYIATDIQYLSYITNLIFEDGVGLEKQYDLRDLNKLQTLTVESPIPPLCPKFSNSQYLTLRVYVPEGTVEAYQNADGWKYFFDIREIGVSDVNEVQSGSRKEIGRYDINGNKVDEDFKGITIVKFSDGSTKKFINR